MKVFLSAKLADVGRAFFTAFMCAAMILTFVVCTGRERNKRTLGETVNVSTTATLPLPVIVIDAGHGGADGGCEGYDGSAEKDCNLSSAKKLRIFFDMAGFDTVMTRETDDDTDGDPSSFSKKKDILNRAELAESIGNSIMLSIHANLSTSEKDKGFTAFYGVMREGSETVAESITEACDESGLCTRIRDVKKAPSSVYLQQHVDRVSVLVECGFLSNHEDLALLKDDLYRQKLMFAVFRGVAAAQKELKVQNTSFGSERPSANILAYCFLSGGSSGKSPL